MNYGNTRKREVNKDNLQLHENLILENKRTVVKRVAGGWLYSEQIPECNLYEVVFVPFNNEFQDIDLNNYL